MYKQEENIWDVESNNNYEKVSEYIDKKIKQITNIKDALKSIKDVFEEYIKMTKRYCNELAMLALKLKPIANTTEGDLIQTMQSLFLFNSVSFETLVKAMEEIYKSSKLKKDSGVSGLEEFYKIYQIQLSDLLNKYCIYINEIENYEKYLMNEVMGIKIDTNINSGNKVTLDAPLRKRAQTTIIHNKHNINEKKVPEKLTNNINQVLETRKAYLNRIAPTNDIVKKLVEFGLNEEKLLGEELYNISKLFVDKLNECVESQKKKNDDQEIILSDLHKQIKEEKFENLNLDIQQYSLHCLSIYINAKKMSRKSNKEIEKDKNLEKLGQKSEEFKIYKDITLDHIENIIKEMQKNGLEIKKKDLEDFEMEKVKDYIDKMTKHIADNTEENFTEEDKNKLKKYFKEKEDYRLFFLQRLNNDRAKGAEIYNKNIFNFLGEIFKCINDEILKTEDYLSFKYISIISMTYFKTEGNKKVYIYEFIKDNEKLQDIEFWKKYSKFVVDLEIKTELKKTQEKSKDKEKLRQDFAAFSNVLTITNNMVNFKFSDELVEQYISFSKENFSLTKAQIDQIMELLEVWKSGLEGK